MPTPSFFTDNSDQQFQQTAAQTEAGRASRIAQMGAALQNEQTAQQMTDAAAVGQAYKGSYADSLQPAAPANLSQDASGGGAPSVTDGQTQVQSVPVVSDQTPVPASPLRQMQLPQVNTALIPPVATSSLAAPAGPKSSGAKVPLPPSPAPQQMAMATQAAPAASVTPNLPTASPFDTPQFQQSLAAHLAALPGNLGAQELMKIKTQRDASISNVMQMIENGHSDEARFTAQRNGLQIPDQFYQNSDLAAAMNYGSKAYADDPDKGQAFVQAYMQAPPGTPTAQRVQSAMQQVGAPTSQGQKELNKALALGRGNYMTQGGGIVNLNPLTHQATPYTTPGGADLTGVTAGYGMHPAAAGHQAVTSNGLKIMNVGGRVVSVDPNGKTTVMLDKATSPEQEIFSITKSIMQGQIKPDPQAAAGEAQVIYHKIHTDPQNGSGLSGQQMPGTGAARPSVPLTGVQRPVYDTAEPLATNPTPGMQPTLPSSLNGRNIQYSPSTGLLRDKDSGQMFDAGGNPYQPQ